MWLFIKWLVGLSNKTRVTPGDCDKEMKKLGTVSESETVTTHGIFNNNKEKKIAKGVI